MDRRLMSRARTYIHRDAMLRRTGAMPDRKDGESAASYEARKSERATRRAKEWCLTGYRIDGTRSIQYDEAEVDRARQRHIHAIPTAA